MEDEKARVIKELTKIPTVSEKAAEGMFLLGVRSIQDLRGKDPVAMYEELRARSDFFAEPCMVNMLKIAVSRAEKR